jgi:hypothetical protein
MARGKLWGGLIVLFLAGILTGIVGTCFYHRYEQQHRGEGGPAARQERLMKHLAQELSLTTEQQAGIQPIVKRTHMDILQLRVQHQPEVERIFARGIADLKPKLSSDQQVKLDGLYAKLQRRWQDSREYLQAAQERQ